MLVDDMGVDSVVPMRRRAISAGKAVVVIFSGQSQGDPGKRRRAEGGEEESLGICWDAGVGCAGRAEAGTAKLFLRRTAHNERGDVRERDRQTR